MTAVHVIRHAKAKSRLEWTDPDDARPLSKRGRREAATLAERFRAEPPDRLLSSPFKRCVETLDPLARQLGVPVETSELLAEGADGNKALELLLSLSSTGALACCTHGDVLHGVLRVVQASGVSLHGPLDAPVASTWALDVVDGRVVEARFVALPES